MKPYIHKDCMGMRGIITFKCLRCNKESNNYSNGIKVCHDCCIANNICRICGKIINEEAKK